MASPTQDEDGIFKGINEFMDGIIGRPCLFDYYPDDEIKVKASSGIISEEPGMFTMGFGHMGYNATHVIPQVGLI